MPPPSVTSAASPAALFSGLDEAAFDRVLAATRSPLLARLRREAFERYAALPPPAAWEEEWRRIDPRVFDVGRFDALPPAAAGAGAAPSPLHAFFDVVVTVDERGARVADRSGVLAGGRMELLTFQEAAERRPEWFEEGWRRALEPDVPERAAPPDRFELANAAFWNAGFAVRVPAGVELERGVLFDVRLSRERAMAMPRLLLFVEERASFQAAECVTGAPGASVAFVGAREAYVAPSGRLRFVELQDLGPTSVCVAANGVRAERDARVEWIPLHFGARATRSALFGEAAGPGAELHLNSFYYGDARQQISHRTLQIHSAPDTQSNLLYKGIVKDAAYALFQGIIVARPGAVRIDAYQQNNNLVLDDGAQADSLPGLLIDADDLKCSHGATAGSLDPEQLFYLRARGLDEAEARRTLIDGFAEDIIGRVPYPAVRDLARAAVARKTVGEPAEEERA